MKYGRAFLKLCMVLALVIGLGMSVAHAATTLQCDPRKAGNKCDPVMEAWCIQNATTLEQNQGKYTYHAVNCQDPNCCIGTKSRPLFLQALVDKNSASKDCWLCFLLEKIFEMGDGLATDLYMVMRDGLLAIVGVFTVLMLMWQAVKVFIDFSGKAARSFIHQVSGFLARVLVVVLLLIQPPSFVGEWVLTPLINFSVGMGLQFISDGGELQSAHVTYFNEHFQENTCVLGCINNDAFWNQNTQNLMFPKSTCNALVGLIQIISIELSTPIQYGQTLMTYSFVKRHWGVFPYFSRFLSGLIMVVFFAILLVFVPFKVVDIFAQLASVGVLLPLGIVLFAFPTTRKYTQNMWQLFVACIIQLMVLSLMVGLTVALFVGGMGQASSEEVLGFFLKGDDEAAAKALLMGKAGILMFVAMALIGWKLISQAGTFAQQLGGAVSLGLGEAASGAFSWVTSRVTGASAAVAVVGGEKIVDKFKKSGEEGS